MNPRLGFSLRTPWIDAAACGALGAGLPVEVIADAWLFADDDALRSLDAIRARGPMFLHALGFNLGSVDGLDPEYVDRVGALADRLDVEIVSGHFAWRSIDGQWSSTFLPIPTRPEVIDHVAARVTAVQDRLQRPLALETPSLYVQPQAATLSTIEALRQLHKRCGSLVLLDVSNVQVAAHNVGSPIAATLAALAPITADMHVAGFSVGQNSALDDHASAPASPTLDWASMVDEPVILEWDRDAPDAIGLAVTLEVLASQLKAARDAGPRWIRPERRPFAIADDGLSFDTLADWQRRFMARVVAGEGSGFRTLFAEQVFSALDLLTPEFPRTAEVFGTDFRVVVRDFVRTEHATDVYGQTWIPRFAAFLAAQDVMRSHPDFATLSEEWSAHG